MSADLLARQMVALKLPPFECEYRFAAHEVGGPGKGLRRRLQERGLKDWRFDFAWPARKFAVEYEGASPAGGRHQRYSGFVQDLDKYHAAQEAGWTVYRCGYKLVASGDAARLIERLLCETTSRT